MCSVLPQNDILFIDHILSAIQPQNVPWTSFLSETIQTFWHVISNLNFVKGSPQSQDGNGVAMIQVSSTKQNIRDVFDLETRMGLFWASKRKFWKFELSRWEKLAASQKCLGYLHWLLSSVWEEKQICIPYVFLSMRHLYILYFFAEIYFSLCLQILFIFCHQTTYR